MVPVALQAAVPQRVRDDSGGVALPRAASALERKVGFAAGVRAAFATGTNDSARGRVIDIRRTSLAAPLRAHQITIFPIMIKRPSIHQRLALAALTITIMLAAVLPAAEGHAGASHSFATATSSGNFQVRSRRGTLSRSPHPHPTQAKFITHYELHNPSSC